MYIYIEYSDSIWNIGVYSFPVLRQLCPPKPAEAQDRDGLGVRACEKRRYFREYCGKMDLTYLCIFVIININTNINK